MPRLAFLTNTPDVEAVVFTDKHEIDAIVFLLDNSAAHFLPELLGNHIRMINDLVALEKAGVVMLYDRQVRSLFDALSIGLSSPLNELRYNVSSARQAQEASDNKPNDIYYRAQMNAVLLQSRLLPVAIQASLHGASIEVSYQL